MRIVSTFVLLLTACFSPAAFATGCTEARAGGCRLLPASDAGTVLECDDPTGTRREVLPAAGAGLGACVFVGIENDRATLRCGDQIVTVADGRPGDAGAPGRDGTACVYEGSSGGQHVITCGDQRFTVTDGAAGANGEAGGQGRPGEPGKNGSDGQSDYTLVLEDARVTTAQPSTATADLECDAKLTTTDRDIARRVIDVQLLVNGALTVGGGRAPSLAFDRAKFKFPLYTEAAKEGDKLQCRITAYAAGRTGAGVGVISTATSPEVTLGGAPFPRLTASMLRAAVTREAAGDDTIVRFSIRAGAEFNHDFGTNCDVRAIYWRAGGGGPVMFYRRLDLGRSGPFTFPETNVTVPTSPDAVYLEGKCFGERAYDTDTYLVQVAAYQKATP